jgi:hypothetical protein
MSIGNLEDMNPRDPQLTEEYIESMKMDEQDSEMEEFFSDSYKEKVGDIIQGFGTRRKFSGNFKIGNQ